MSEHEQGHPPQTPHGLAPEVVFEILAAEHAEMLEGYLRVLLGPSSDIDDVFQESMIVAWRRLDEYDRTRPFGAWLRGIARVLVLRQGRLNARAPRTTDPAVLTEIDHRFELIAARPGDTFRGRAGRLLDCVQRLPDHMRDAIELVYMRGATVAAAAGALNAKTEAVKKRLQRGRELIARCMGFDGHEAGETA